MEKSDALVIGSPVYWASPSGQIIEFMDKFCSQAGNFMLHKPAAAVTSARRAGTTATLDVHGNTPEEVKQDEEGLQIMRTLGNNMAWLLRCIEAGAAAGVEVPATEEKIKTNFIR